MKKTILSCLMLAAGLTASAQEQKGTTEYVFEPHWYIQVQPVGVQYTLGEVDFGDLLSYNVQAAVGRQFSPLWGARLAVNAWQSKAGSKFEQANKEFKWKWNYVAPTIDATFNLSNAICGFNPNRVFNLSAFAGIGLNIGWKNDEAATANQGIKNGVLSATGTNGETYKVQNNGKDVEGLEYLWDGTKVRLMGQFGLNADFKVSEKVSLGLELSANTLNDKYNSKKAKNWDWYFNALAGVKVALGKTYSTRFIPAPEPEIRYVEKIVEKIVEVPAKAEEPAATAAEPLRRDIFFQIGKTVIRKSEQQKVNEVVEYLNANPEAKVNVTGYADAGTGNDRINDRLAAGRADVVVKALKKAGIAASRISYDSKGARVQPFADNDSNRVSIVIAE